jgi:hypothetical protein
MARPDRSELPTFWFVERNSWRCRAKVLRDFGKNCVPVIGHCRRKLSKTIRGPFALGTPLRKSTHEAQGHAPHRSTATMLRAEPAGSKEGRRPKSQ